MKPRLLVLSLFILLTGVLTAQSFSAGSSVLNPEEQHLLKKLTTSKAGIPRLQALLDLSKYYIVRPGEFKEDLDRGMAYAIQARDLGTRLKYTTGYNEATILIGRVFVERGDSRSAFRTIEEANDSTKISLWLIMSYYYFYGGQLTHSLDSAFYSAQQAGRLAKKLGPAKEMIVHLHLLELYTLQKDTRNAIKENEEIIRLSRQTPLPDPHHFYTRLSSLQMADGNYNMALYYALEALKLMQQTGNYKKAEDIYENLAFVCRNTGQFLKAAEYFEMAVAVYREERRFTSLWYAREKIADALRKVNKNQEALALVYQTAREFPPANHDEKLVMLRCLGNCYKALKQTALAEKNFLEMIEVGKTRAGFDANGYKDLGQFYIEQGRFEEGGVYIKKMLSSIGNYTFSAQAHIYYLLYKVDSAAGDYLSALNYLVKNKQLDDAVWEDSKSRHIREIQIQYETEKKDQELKLKEKNILLLSRQASLRQKDLQQARLQLQYEARSKELARSEAVRKDKDLQLHQKNIELLQNEALLKQASLSKANLATNVTFGAVALLFIIIALLYNRYRLKQRSARELNLKNHSLENLLNEKELLLKEVHHRVKNNLHTIISLLETQSSYLKDDALLAVQNSQHRIYAMSLIHQKLYQLDNTTNVDMAIYLPELLNYLQDSFDVRNSIRFRTNIEHIHLDIAQAIPAGLILNEAITNSIKYAFPGASHGEIEIEMVETQGTKIRFLVADNGIGLPRNWQKLHRNSLGLKLMKGLSADIKAKFSIENNRGTKIMVEFEKYPFSREIPSYASNGQIMSYA